MKPVSPTGLLVSYRIKSTVGAACTPSIIPCSGQCWTRHLPCCCSRGGAAIAMLSGREVQAEVAAIAEVRHPQRMAQRPHFTFDLGPRSRFCGFCSCGVYDNCSARASDAACQAQKAQSFQRRVPKLFVRNSDQRRRRGRCPGVDLAGGCGDRRTLARRSRSLHAWQGASIFLEARSCLPSAECRVCGAGGNGSLFADFFSSGRLGGSSEQMLLGEGAR